MVWISQQTKNDILELATSENLNPDGAFAMYNGKLYYIDVNKGFVEPVIQHKF